jgi:hypothetical protein
LRWEESPHARDIGFDTGDIGFDTGDIGCWRWHSKSFSSQIRLSGCLSSLSSSSSSLLLKAQIGIIFGHPLETAPSNEVRVLICGGFFACSDILLIGSESSDGGRGDCERKRRWCHLRLGRRRRGVGGL